MAQYVTAPIAALINRCMKSGHRGLRFKLRTRIVITAQAALDFKKAIIGNGRTKTRFAPIMHKTTPREYAHKVDITAPYNP